VLIVAASGEVLFANRAAEAPLTEGDGIRIEKFALRASMRAGVAQFQRLIATAVEGLDAAGGVNCARPAGAASTAECTGGAAEDRVDVVRDRPPRRSRVRSQSGQRDADRAGKVARSLSVDRRSEALAACAGCHLTSYRGSPQAEKAPLRSCRP